MLKTYTLSQKQSHYQNYDPEIWLHHYCDQVSGGYVVIHRQRELHSYINKQEQQKFVKELSMCMVFAKNGYCLEMLEEMPRIPSPDVRINGVFGDLKRLGSHNNIVKEAKSAVRHQRAEVMMFAFTHETSDIHAELLKLYRRYSIYALYYFEGKGGMYQNFPA